MSKTVKIIKIKEREESVSGYGIASLLKTLKTLMHTDSPEWKREKIVSELKNRGYEITYSGNNFPVITKKKEKMIEEEIEESMFDTMTRGDLEEKILTYEKIIRSVEDDLEKIASPKVDYHPESEVMKDQVISNMIKQAKKIISNIKEVV